MRYFLLDRVTELVPGERARGQKCVTLTDEVLHDHFPDHPILPGALIVEACAQLAGLLLEATFQREGDGQAGPPRRALLAQIEKAKFHETCGPGDRLELLVTLDSRSEGAAQVTAAVEVDGRKVARARLTFVMKAIDSDAVHAQRRWLYRLWTKDLDPPPVLL